MRHRFPVDGEYSDPAAAPAHLHRLHPRARHARSTLDVRVDGRLDRPEFHRSAAARPPHATAAPASFAGNTPLFGHPDWETYVLGADEDLQVTLPRRGGRAGRRRLVRAQALGNRGRRSSPGRPASPSPSTSAGRGTRPSTAWRSADPIRDGRPRRHREPPRRSSRCHPDRGDDAADACAQRDPGPAGPAGLPAARHRRRRRPAVRVLRAPAGGRTASRRASSSPCSGCSPTPSSCSGSSATPSTRRRAPRTR